jgi:hypothetical protein
MYAPSTRSALAWVVETNREMVLESAPVLGAAPFTGTALDRLNCGPCASRNGAHCGWSTPPVLKRVGRRGRSA